MSKLIETEPINLALKTGILILLCFQNSGHALLTRYSQGIRKESYSSSGNVLKSCKYNLVDLLS
jgi:hypothetical protein